LLVLDTGLDSATAVLGGLRDDPHAHLDVDHTIVIRSGAGTLWHGPSPDALEAVDVTAPCVVVVRAGTWHAATLADATVPPLSFFTRPDATIEPFAQVGPRATQATVSFDRLADWAPAPVSAPVGPPPAGGMTSTDDATDRRTPRAPARVIPYQPPDDGYVLPLDSGSDSLFVMISRGRSWDRAPVEVPVHRHDDEDELILIDAGEGWLLNGPAPDSVARTPFRGPCLLVMPAGNFHRVVRTDDAVVDSVLVYAHRSAVVPAWAGILERTCVAGPG
jgi:hypothetical protein